MTFSCHLIALIDRHFSPTPIALSFSPSCHLNEAQDKVTNQFNHISLIVISLLQKTDWIWSFSTTALRICCFATAYLIVLTGNPWIKISNLHQTAAKISLQLETLYHIHRKSFQDHEMAAKAYLKLAFSLESDQQAVTIFNTKFMKFDLLCKALEIFSSLNKSDPNLNPLIGTLWLYLALTLFTQNPAPQFTNESIEEKMCYLNAIDYNPDLGLAYVKLGQLLLPDQIVTLLDETVISQKGLYLKGASFNSAEAFFLLGDLLKNENDCLTLLNGDEMSQEQLYQKAHLLQMMQ